ncbi:MAG: hypothetical protein LIP28_07045, partial [Deltaproteobacteria bacterium]|nr:hypothetical protein [Deltaproteobacteria bacterium]
MPKPPLMQRLAQLQDLTPSEKKLAALFKRDYPQLAFDNLTDIGAKAGVGKATVTRFVQRLGYLNFYEFSKTLRNEVAHHMDLPVLRLGEMNDEGRSADPDAIFSRYLDSAIANLQRTKELHSGANFAKAVELLKESIKKTYGLKGDKVVNMNIAAVEKASGALEEVKYPASWADTTEGAEVCHCGDDDYIREIVRPILAQQGDKLP